MEEPLPPAAPRSLTGRSVALGVLLALTVCVVTPYNDFVVNNAPLIGSYLPPVLVLAMLAVVLLVNGPLHRFAPRWALRPGELAVVLAMGLIACSVPGQGLLRQVLPLPVAPFYFTGQDPKYLELFKAMHLPPWLFAVRSAETGSGERVVTAFYSRLQPGEPLPWARWWRPALGWGVFVSALMTALVALACLLRFQWTVNERLAFPIAQLQGMLVAPPPPGRAFNDVFASRLFWSAALFVLVVESAAVLKLYFPTYTPAMPYWYDLTSILGNAPWNTLPGWVKTNTVYFTVIGLSYFTTTRVSFSLWGTAVLVALLRWVFDPTQLRLTDPAVSDQGLGAAMAFMLGVLWVGRQHWAVIGRALVGRPRPDDARGAFVSYRAAAVAFIFGVVGMFAWLVVVGCTPWLAAGIVGMILTAHVVTARVVAETGMAIVRIPVPLDSILKGLPARLITPRGAFIYGATHYGFMHGARESALVYAQHGLNVIDAAEATADRGGSRDRRTLPVLAATLAIAVIASAAVSLVYYYGHATPLADDGSGLLNHWALEGWPKTYLVEFPQSVARGTYLARGYSVWTQLMIGVVVTVVLQGLSWRFAAWPLLPVGYLMCGNFYVTMAVPSLLIGWLAKTLILRFGGAKLFNDLKPLFIGLIFGEALSVGLWLLVTLVLAMNGNDFHVVRFLPL